MKGEISLNIGDKIYKKLSFSGIGEYIVTGKIERKCGMLYEVECQACNHGDKCLLVVEPLANYLSFSYMVNDDDGDQRCWHDDGIFYTTVDKAKKAYYEKIILDYKKKVDECKSQRSFYEKEIEKITDLLAIPN
jgi:hypothetical protein